MDDKEQKMFLKGLKEEGKRDFQYATLFQILLKMEEYNGIKASTLLRKKTGAKAYKKVKEYLIQAILDFLNERAGYYDAENQIKKHFFLADLFLKRGLYQITEIELSKGEKLMFESELFEHLNWFAQIKQQLSKIGYYSLERGISDYGTILGAFRKYENLQKYKELEMQASFIRKDSQGKGNPRVFDKLLNHALLEKPQRALLVSAKILFHKIHCHFCNYIEDFQGLLAHRKAIIDLFEKHPAFQKHHQHQYLGLLIDWANVELINNQPDMQPVTQHLELVDWSEQAADLQTWYLNHRLLQLRKNNAYEAGMELIQQQEEIILSGMDLMDPDKKLHVYENLIVFAFACDDKHSFRLYLNAMRDFIEGVELFEKSMMLRVVELMRMYDTGAYEACEGKIRSIKRYFNLEKFKDIHRSIVNHIAKAIKQYFDDEPKEEIQETFTSLFNQLVKLSGQDGYEEFPYSIWCIAKAKGVSILDLKK